GATVRLPLSAELQLPIPRGVGDRVLAALAHVAVILAARLPVYPARRQSGRHAVRLPQSDDNNAAGRAMARRRLELRGLGRAARRRAMRQQAVAGGGAAPSDADRRAGRLA